MAKVKLTKTELKAQKDALSRFQRFLPMLQLKKQQLQLELSILHTHEETVERERRGVRSALSSWAGLLSDSEVEIPVALERIRISHANIAGVRIPVYEGIETHRFEIDLFATPAWVDDVADVAEKLMALQARQDVIHEQVALIEQELRVTAQRVNLFEKVKIPECKENIRVIGIMLGDEQTAAVARGKIAKSRDKSGEPLDADKAGEEVA